MLVLAAIGLASAASASAQTGQREISLVDLEPAARPGSPSNATSTVSPSTVPQAMDRLAGDRGLDVSLGSLYAEGDFGGATDTSIWSAALGVRYAAGPLRLNASLPWMRIRGNGTVFTGIDATPIVVARDVRPVRTSNHGIGDLTVGANYVVTGDNPTELELSGRVKIPTAADSTRLSTQKVDYAVGAQVTHAAGAVAPFVSATYRIFGDPSGFDLRNGFAGSAGASVMLGERTFLVGSYHYARAASRLVRDSHEVFGGASTALGRSGLRATGFVTAGLSSGAPSVSAGASLSLGL